MQQYQTTYLWLLYCEQYLEAIYTDRRQAEAALDAMKAQDPNPQHWRLVERITEPHDCH